MNRLRSLFAIDAGLPPPGPRRWAVIAYMVVGGIVALLVPIFLAIVLWGFLTGAQGGG